MSITEEIIHILSNRYDLQFDSHQTLILQEKGIIDEHGRVYIIPYNEQGKVVNDDRIRLDQPIRITHDQSHDNIIVDNSMNLMDEINAIAENL